MPDTKTVMSWLEGLTQDDWQSFHSDSEVQQIAMATLELLKEQEAIEPRNTYSTTPSGKVIPHIFCGKCNKEIYTIYAFCPFCGREVKWK